VPVHVRVMSSSTAHSVDRATNLSFNLLIVIRSADLKNYFAEGQASLVHFV